MKNVIQAASCSNSLVATQGHAAQLSAHRRAIMDMLVGSPVITTEEYDTAMQRTLACQNLATLQKWYRNAVREIARREELEPVTAPTEYATAAQQQEVIKLANSVYITRAEKTKALLSLPRLARLGVVTLVGELWATILHRQEQAAEGWSTATDSFANAA
jgi:hypothetical protein